MSQDDDNRRSGGPKHPPHSTKQAKEAYGGAFDAISAAQELEAILGKPSTSSDAAKANQGYPAMLEQEIEALNQDIEKARMAEKSADERAERALIEVEAVKQRADREAAKQLELRTRKLLHDFLDVADDLDRGIEAARAMDHNPKVIDGIELVRRRFDAMLARHNIVGFKPKGERFDPNLHEAMSTVPVSSPTQDGTVIGVIKEGYMVGDEVLRPAGVAVGKFGG